MPNNPHAKRLGIETVAVFSDADRNALHVTLADEAVHIGVPHQQLHLQMQRIVDAAKTTGSQAIHPGYGFLSENAAFCELCAANGLVFIGPPAQAIEAMGSKATAKQIMQQAGVPLLPGYHDDDQEDSKLQQAADNMGYPVLPRPLPAVAARVCDGESLGRVQRGLAAAARGSASFGNQDMLVEKYLEHARHVEVQVFCDSHGNGVYLFDVIVPYSVEQKPLRSTRAQSRWSATTHGRGGLRAASAVGYGRGHRGSCLMPRVISTLWR